MCIVPTFTTFRDSFTFYKMVSITVTYDHALQWNEFNINECKETANTSQLTWMWNSACTSHTTHKDIIVLERKPEDIKIGTSEIERSMQEKFRWKVHVKIDVI